MDAVLDVPLSNQLAAGKLFVGQKLRVTCSFVPFLLFFYYFPLIRKFPLELLLPYSLFCPVKIWGAGLCGWFAPVSPLEVLFLFVC